MINTKINTIDDAIQKRIEQINSISYFHKIELYKKGEENYIAKEFITDLGIIEKGFDVSDFLEQCKIIDFGPDTNITNFVMYKDKIYYIDQDYIDWVLNPQQNKYDEKKRYMKKYIW